MPEGELGGVGGWGRGLGGGSGQHPSVGDSGHRGPVACEERTVRFGGSDPWAGRAAGQGWGRSLERHSPGTQSRARGLGGGLPGQALGLFWPATHGALPLGSTPGPQGGRGCPWEVRQPWERGHGKKGISRNQRFI